MLAPNLAAASWKCDRKSDVANETPGTIGLVDLLLAATDADYIMASLNQPGNQISADVRFLQ